jgi:hypothetical protein
VWINAQYPFSVTPAASGLLKNQGELALLQKYRDVPPNSFPPLLYGQVEETIVGGEDNQVVIRVLQNTNRININVNGLTPTSDSYLFAIKDNNGAYDFENNFADHPDFIYSAESRYTSAGQLSASLSVLKLAENRSPMLYIRRNSSPPDMIFPEYNLIEIIRELYPGNDFSKGKTYDINIEFRGMDIIIIDWENGGREIIL